MNINDCFPNKYLKSSDLQGRSVKVMIDDVIKEEMVDGSEKPVVSFSNKDKGLVLNRTNATLLAESFGPETNKWRGSLVELYVIKVNFQGRMVDGISIRVPAAAPAMEYVEADVPF